MRKRILMVALLAVLFVMVITLTSTVKADNATITKVTGLTKGTVTNEGSVYTYKLTKNDLNELEWHSKDEPTGEEGVDRVANGWDVGFRLTFSADVAETQVLKTNYTNSTGTTTKGKTCTIDKANKNQYSAWIHIDNNILEGKTKEFQFAKFEFYFEDAPQTKTTVIIMVDPTDVKLKEPEGGKMVKVVVDGYEFTLANGKNLTDDKEKGGLTAGEVEQLKALMTPEEGYKFVGLYKKGTNVKVSLEDAITENMEIEVRFEEIPTVPADKETAKGEKDSDTPKTGVSSAVVIVSSIVATISLAGIVVSRKK